MNGKAKAMAKPNIPIAGAITLPVVETCTSRKPIIGPVQEKGIRDAWTYGASIVVIYVTLGLAITLIFGASALNALSTNAVFNILFFLMLVVFAASFFGAFELTLPSKKSKQCEW